MKCVGEVGIDGSNGLKIMFFSKRKFLKKSFGSVM